MPQQIEFVMICYLMNASGKSDMNSPSEMND